MQPYQQASQETRRLGEKPASILKQAAGAAITGGSAFAGAGAASKILPFLSKYIPESLAIAGLNRLDPRWGKLFKNAMDDGYDFEEVKDMIQKKMGENEGESEPKNTEENRNIIEQVSPELHQFIDQEVRKGRQLIEAGAIAQNDKRFANVINKLQNTHKTPWSSILESVYGQRAPSSENPQQPQIQQQNNQQLQGEDKWAQVASALQGLLNS